MDALSFEVGKGEIVGFLGPNGAGKSTTMRMIMGFIRPSKGTITVNGLEVQSNRQAIRQQIGYLPEGNTCVTIYMCESFCVLLLQ